MLPVRQITKKLFTIYSIVSNTASMGGIVNLTLFALLTADISLSQILFLLLKVMKTLS